MSNVVRLGVSANVIKGKYRGIEYTAKYDTLNRVWDWQFSAVRKLTYSGEARMPEDVRKQVHNRIDTLLDIKKGSK